MHVPGGVRTCVWQTGKFLAAVLVLARQAQNGRANVGLSGVARKASNLSNLGFDSSHSPWFRGPAPHASSKSDAISHDGNPASKSPGRCPMPSKVFEGRETTENTPHGNRTPTPATKAPSPPPPWVKFKWHRLEVAAPVCYPDFGDDWLRCLADIHVGAPSTLAAPTTGYGTLHIRQVLIRISIASLTCRSELSSC